jgi:YHS domain-containing protein
MNGTRKRSTVMTKHLCGVLAAVLMCAVLTPSVRAAEAEKAGEAMKGHVATDKDKELVDKLLPAYPMKTCVISGKELDAKALNYVYEGKLVRFCCPMCVKPFEKDPAKYMTMIDEAAKKGAKGPTGSMGPAGK